MVLFLRLIDNMQKEEITIGRLIDADLVNSVIKHDKIFPHLTDDFTNNADVFDTQAVVENESVYFIGVAVDDELASVFYYQPHNHATFEVHSAVLPKYRGKLSVKMAKESLKWIFDNTPCRKVITHVPVGNNPAFVLSKKVGMQIEGINRKSIMKGGKMIDQTLLGITIEELSCQ